MAVGRPYGQRIRIVDEEIWVSGPNVADGYWGRPDRGDTFTEDGWLRTGDLGKLDRAGRLVIIGRVKDVIVTSTGENIYPDDIERLLGTILREIHNLPGTTFSNPRERGEYDSEAKAAMTLAELEKWLATYIVEVYHQRMHPDVVNHLVADLSVYVPGQ